MIKGSNVHIRKLKSNDSIAMLRLQKENREFFEEFSMSRGSDFYTIRGQLERIKKYEEDINQDRDYFFGIFNNDGNGLVGTINLFQVVRGSIQSAFIGYFLDKKHNGKGFTTEAVKLLVEYGFEELRLHRIEAGVMPHNAGSIRVLEKSGFHKEGIAKKNVKINGQWEDHQVLAIINPKDLG
ncbi:GNAT family N-acetyltransferase [Virgibacillus sp. JSM 102003]|uniref:GNAT family N-acetyltransferase n=1 Tax=Virgibacillus sp. JSM 102003 TaxID=1562108 RepID=UPI0035BEEF06